MDTIAEILAEQEDPGPNAAQDSPQALQHPHRDDLRGLGAALHSLPRQMSNGISFLIVISPLG